MKISPSSGMDDLGIILSEYLRQCGQPFFSSHPTQFNRSIEGRGMKGFFPRWKNEGISFFQGVSEIGRREFIKYHDK